MNRKCEVVTCKVKIPSFNYACDKHFEEYRHSRSNLTFREWLDTKNNQTDPVNKPTHYQKSKLEVIDILEAMVEGLSGQEAGLTWSAGKYLCRWKQKGGLEDLKKARWYLNRLIEKLEKP